MTFDTKEFWEEKILTWENGRYQETGSKAPSVIERVADRASESLRFRLSVTCQILSECVDGAHVLEIGCGSGLLARQLLEAGCASYQGIDVSERAIAMAKERNAGSDWCGKMIFTTGTIDEMPDKQADLVFSLGLLDWLGEEEISKIFSRQGGARFLHSISERKFSLQQLIHRLYVQVSYGYRTNGYVPQYHSIAEIAAHAASSDPIHVFRDRRLSFGALVANFDIGPRYRPSLG